MLSDKPVQNAVIAQSKTNDKSTAFFTRNVTKKLVETGKEEITIDSDRNNRCNPPIWTRVAGKLLERCLPAAGCLRACSADLGV